MTNWVKNTDSSVFPTTILLLLIAAATVVNGIGVNWGTQASNPLSPSVVVRMMKDNGIQKVKIFDADKEILNALSDSGIEVMVGIPNDMLYSLANDNVAAQNWVSQNITSHISTADHGGGSGTGVNFKYIAVGNEPFLKTLNGSYHALVLPALQNIQFALNKVGHGNHIKLTVPLNADIYETSTGLPSGGDFRSDIHNLIINIVNFLQQNNSPFTINIYPFISLYSNPDFPFDYAFFNGYTSPLQDNNGKTYDNMLEANYDTLIWALQKNGFTNMSIILGEVGWPTDGDINANLNNARRFNQGFLDRILTGKGTPMKPDEGINAYLFSFIDEDTKSIEPGKFERHWGLFYFDGRPKYELNFGVSGTSSIVGARSGTIRHLPRRWCIMSPLAILDDPHIESSVAYACGHADCTSLGYGCSCDNLDIRGNISYAFNSYYQVNNQLDTACKFPNLSVVTTSDPTIGTCKFFIGIEKMDMSGGKCGDERNYSSVFVFLGYMVVVFVFST